MHRTPSKQTARLPHLLGCATVCCLVPPAVPHATAQPIQVVLGGNIHDLRSPVVGDPPGLTLEDLGLEEGDPFQFSFLVDPDSARRLNDRGLHHFDIDQLIFHIDGARFDDETPMINPGGLRLSVNSAGESGLRFGASPIGPFTGELNGVQVSFVTTALHPLFFSLTTGDIGASPDTFPTSLSFADFIDARFESIALFPDTIFGQFVGSFGIQLNDVNVRVIPEPATAMLSFVTMFALAGIAGQRRRPRDLAPHTALLNPPECVGRI